MKLTELFFRQTLVASILAAGLALAPISIRANEVGDADPGNDGEVGGEIEGTVVFESDVDLLAATTAPVEPGAPGVSGKAFLLAVNQSGVTTATLDAQIFGLALGDYVVSALSADGTRTVLGSFTLEAEPPDPVLEENDGPNDDPTSDEDDDGPKADPNEDPSPFIGEDSYFHFGGEGTPWPAGFNPLAIQRVFVTTKDGTAVLTADFTQAEDETFNADIEVEPSAGAPRASGKVIVRSKTRNGRALAQRFSLVAKGLPANQSVVVVFNGGKSLKLRTSRKGTLGVVTRRLAGVRPSALHRVEIKNARSGQTVAHANL